MRLHGTSSVSLSKSAPPDEEEGEQDDSEGQPVVTTFSCNLGRRQRSRSARSSLLREDGVRSQHVENAVSANRIRKQGKAVKERSETQQSGTRQSAE